MWESRLDRRKQRQRLVRCRDELGEAARRTSSEIAPSWRWKEGTRPKSCYNVGGKVDRQRRGGRHCGATGDAAELPNNISFLITDLSLLATDPCHQHRPQPRPCNIYTAAILATLHAMLFCAIALANCRICPADEGSTHTIVTSQPPQLFR